MTSRPPRGNAYKHRDALDAQHLSVMAARVDGINPADLTRQINAIQMQLLDLAKAKTEALAAARHVDLASIETVNQPDWPRRSSASPPRAHHA